MRAPSSVDELHALRAEPPLLPTALRLLPRDRLRLRIPAVGAVPYPLLAAASHDGDLTACVQHPEHQPHLPRAPPPMRLALRRCVILDLPGEQRPTLLELAQDVTAVRGV